MKESDAKSESGERRSCGKHHGFKKKGGKLKKHQ